MGLQLVDLADVLSELGVGGALADSGQRPADAFGAVGDDPSGDQGVEDLNVPRVEPCHPVDRPLGRLGKTAAKKVAQHEAANGTAIVPEDDELQARTEGESEGTVHTEIQYLLVKLGADMGFDVHVASNDQSRVWKGHRLGDMPRRRERLLQQFDPVTNRTIELIDVL